MMRGYGGYFDGSIFGDIGFLGFGDLVRPENVTVLRSFVPSLPTPADFDNPAVWNAISYVIGPEWADWDKARRRAAFVARNASRVTALKSVPSPSIMRSVQAAIGMPKDGKLGPKTAARLDQRHPGWRLVVNWHEPLLAKARPKAPGPEVEPEPTTKVEPTKEEPTKEEPKKAKLPGAAAGFFERNKTALMVGGALLVAGGIWMALKPAPRASAPA